MNNDAYEPGFQIKPRREFISTACLTQRHKDCGNAYCICECHLTDSAIQIQEAA